MSEPAHIIPSPLANAHRTAGVAMGVWFGCALPDDFGDARAEQSYLRNSVALVDKNYRAYLSLTGPDRVRYLNALLTNNIKELSVHRGNISLLLSPQGRILAELETYALPENLFCVSYAMIRERLIEILEKYIIMDDVTLEDRSAKFGTLALEGPKAHACVAELTSEDLNKIVELECLEVEVRGGGLAIPCRIVKRSYDGVAGAEFIIGREQLEAAWEMLKRAAVKHGGGPVGYNALSAQRLAQGVAWFGYDFGENQIPHEAGLETSHISYTKGCYVGQEIVERVRSRGQVNRRRVRLSFSGDNVPPGGTTLTVGGQNAGSVTRAAKSWFPPVILAMGYLRKEFQAAGTRVEWNGGSGTVDELLQSKLKHPVEAFNRIEHQ